MERLCGYVNTETRARCKAKAEYEIYTTNAHEENEQPTNTCAAHIAEMLTDAFEHRIFRVN